MVIYECSCGCRAQILKEGKEPVLLFRSLIVEKPEVITHICPMGFVNGKYSLLPEGLLFVIEYLEKQ